SAVVTSLPLLVVIGLLAGLAVWGIRKTSAIEGIEAQGWPAALDTPAWAVMVSVVVVLVTVGVPIGAMELSMKRPFDLGRMWNTLAPQMGGSIWVASATGAIALLTAAWEAAR